MKTKSINTKVYLLSVALLLCTCSYAQFNIGAFYSTFNLPAVKLKAPGFGITGEYEANEKVVYALSFTYTTKKMPPDSVYYYSPNGNNYYIHEQPENKFLHLSLDFYGYLIGSADYSSKVSFFLGGGASVLQTQLKINYQDATIPSQTIKSTTEGFEFLIGGDVKLWFFKLFLRGRANIFLKYPVENGDETVLPLLTNTQIGFLIPLSGQNKFR